MDQLDLAIHNTAHKDKDSAKRLALQLAIPYQVFINKCNYNNDTHFLKLSEARSMMILTDDFQILDALDLDRPEKKPEAADLNEALLKMGSELGDVYNAISEAKKDNLVTAREKRNILREVVDVKKAIQDIENLVSALWK